MVIIENLNVLKKFKKTQRKKITLLMDNIENKTKKYSINTTQNRTPKNPYKSNLNSQSMNNNDP